MAEAVVSMVIEGLTGVLVEGLRDVLVKEVKFLSAVGDQIEHAQTELILMRGFLKDADAKQKDDEVVRIWVRTIRDAAYDLEDVIESFALKVALKRGGSVKLVLKRFVGIFNEGVNLHKIGSEIESITTKLSKLRSRLQSYNIKQIMGTQYEGATSFERQKEQRQTYPHVIERDVVGLEKDMKMLATQLVKEENCPQVVSIWGMGGSGKTTLAKQVYNHNEVVKRHFDCFAWVCVSQECQGKEVLEDILIKLTRTTKKEEIEDISKMKKDQIAEKLYIFQKEKKCLVVLDDIWTRDTWNSLKPGFPVGEETKSRILLTTRKKDVAEIAGGNGFIHESRALDDKESWELFKKIAISGRDQTNSKIDAEKEELGKKMPQHCAESEIDAEKKELGKKMPQHCAESEIDAEEEELGKKMPQHCAESEIDIEKEELGKKMLKHCAGLPLAITVLAGLLATKVTVEEWKTVNKNVDVYIRTGTNLDQEYKGDQEYAGHFPEDYEIPVKKLAQLWIAEGFISFGSQRHGSAEVLEDVAYACLIELVERCMVQVGTLGSTKKIKTCHLHDLMRDLCLVKAEEEDFLHVVNSTSTITKAATISKVRRLAVYVDKNSGDRFALTGNDHLRSLLFFRDAEYHHFHQNNKILRSVLCNFKLLRVLKFERIRHLVVPGNIGNLVHLRFLSLRGSYVPPGSYVTRGSGSWLPSSLGNLVCLQTLDLRLNNLAVKVPNVIWKMKELRHLYLPVWYGGRLTLATLGNLQSLVNVAGADCDFTHLAELTNLRKLSIRYWLENREEMMKSNGITFNHLRSLSLFSPLLDTPMNMVSSCPHIYKLKLNGGIGYQSLEGLLYYQNLTKMSLFKTCLQLESLKILEKIPNLRMLWIGEDALKNVSSEVVVSEEGYPNLEFLSLDRVRELKSWSIEKGGMPSLCRLSIASCSELRAVPEGLENVKTLKELTIQHMRQEFCSRVGEGGEDFYKIKHVPTLLITDISSSFGMAFKLPNEWSSVL